jgi:hypothetical protein
MKRCVAGLLLPAAACVHAAQQGVHLHGAAELLVAVEKETLVIELRSPLDGLIGFEYTPKTAAQKAAVKSMVDRLDKPAMLFKLPQAAACTAGSVKSAYQFNQPPAAPAKSAKGAKAKEEEEDRADLTASFPFTCTNPDKLDSMEVLIFTEFPRTRSVKARIIGPRGQSAVTLTPARRVIKF